MGEEQIVQVMREGLYLVLLVSAPAVLASLVVGLFVNVIQAATQLQDHTISFVPKVVAVFAVLAITGGWIGTQLVRFTDVLLKMVHLLR